jgi:hypothetical protein
LRESGCERFDPLVGIGGLLAGGAERDRHLAD